MSYVVCGKNEKNLHTTYEIRHTVRITPILSAIVLNFKSPRDTVTCVQALENQTIANQIEILVVDNHSEDDSIGVIRNRLTDLPHVKIIESARNTGYGQGNGFGLHYATGNYILIINPDNALHPDALELMLEKMEREQDIGIISPKLIHEDHTVRHSARSFPTFFDVLVKRLAPHTTFKSRIDRYLQRTYDPDCERDVDWVVGACMLIRRSALEKVGTFDPRFFLFFEDMDLCRRMKNAGFRIHYFPAAIASDKKHRLTDGSLISVFLSQSGRAHIASAVKYFWKWRAF